MKISEYVLGTSPLRRKISTTVYIAGALAVAIGAFALLSGYNIGPLNPLLAKKLFVGGLYIPTIIFFANIAIARERQRRNHTRRYA